MVMVRGVEEKETLVTLFLHQATQFNLKLVCYYFKFRGQEVALNFLDF